MGDQENGGVNQNDISWVRRGKQKKALSQSLTRPMQVTQLRKTMAKMAPKVQLRDVWHLLTSFEQRHLVVCLTPEEPKGRIYYFTKLGVHTVNSAFGLALQPLASGLDWQRYSHVIRAPLRTVILMHMAKHKEPVTITNLRKALVEKNHAVGLNAIIRAVKELHLLDLIHTTGITPLRQSNLYRITAIGEQIAEDLLTFILIWLLRFPNHLLAIYF
ncbi:MAG: hypothetical protein ACXWJX_02395 [Limisphaerales bacterium]